MLLAPEWLRPQDLHPMSSYFETAVQKKMRDIEQASVNIEFDDPLKHAALRGRHGGLSEALDLYKKSIREDIEADL